MKEHNTQFLRFASVEWYLHSRSCFAQSTALKHPDALGGYGHDWLRKTIRSN
jgi:hypothetical protein